MAKKSNKIVNYFKDVKSELKKVVWPGFKQVKNNTLIVIACILVIGIFIWVSDAVFDITLGKIVKRAQGEEAAATETTETTDNAGGSQEMSSEEMVAQMKAYLANFGIDYDGEKYYDKEGKELTEDEVTQIIGAASGSDAADQSTGNAGSSEAANGSSGQ